jgi:hypothetical protein
MGKSSISKLKPASVSVFWIPEKLGGPYRLLQHAKEQKVMKHSKSAKPNTGKRSDAHSTAHAKASKPTKQNKAIEFEHSDQELESLKKFVSTYKRKNYNLSVCPGTY